MRYQVASQDLTCDEYPIDYPMTLSSREVALTSDFWDTFSSALIRERKLKLLQLFNLLYILEIDFSSTAPRFEGRSETSLVAPAVTSEEAIMDWLVESDFIVEEFPTKMQNVRLRITSVEKAVPSSEESEVIE